MTSSNHSSAESSPPLDNLRKAAILLLSLPPEQANQMLARLAPRQVEAVTRAMSSKRAYSNVERQAVIREFAQFDPAAAPCGSPAVPPPHFNRDRKSEVLRPRSIRRLPAIRRPLSFLHDVDSGVLFELFVDEHPQAIAFALSQLPSSKAASIAAMLPPKLQLGVIRRIATLEPVDPQIASELAAALRARLHELDHSHGTPSSRANKAG